MGPCFSRVEQLRYFNTEEELRTTKIAENKVLYQVTKSLTLETPLVVTFVLVTRVNHGTVPALIPVTSTGMTGGVRVNVFDARYYTRRRKA